MTLRIFFDKLMFLKFFYKFKFKGFWYVLYCIFIGSTSVLCINILEIYIVVQIVATKLYKISISDCLSSHINEFITSREPEDFLGLFIDGLMIANLVFRHNSISRSFVGSLHYL
ncbi:hypothetical protein EDEG_02503 [Edhazardia aedis USNM 41457]|uniref:Uncharacterized protein n=1 Tax=Edhazardia aedis (strain USNM 41457) TaxID=1003232 RepID=J9DP57_EDHAE|nr:hypothetical protein EDEG_02503 [Edhazardia aedis USNM 41457]|eukprot:EJW03117.1 hypothetical protein EDEG_02503 [Edhazardia aedis USNM 41457]